VKKAVSRGKLTAEKGEAILALIHPTADYANVKGSDLVVEAVFENREVKAGVTKLAEAQLAPPRSSAPTPRPCRSPAWPRPASARPRSSASTSSRRSTR
jgi:hypothetical protein